MSDDWGKLFTSSTLDDFLEKPFEPKTLESIEDTGLSSLWLQDHILKVLYYQGYLSGFAVADIIALPYTGIVDKMLEVLKRDKLIEVRSSEMGIGDGAFVYTITMAGIDRAREALERSQYAGPAPVPLTEYNKACIQQSKGRIRINNELLYKSLAHLVLKDEVLERLGPAINSGKSIFLYGPPGDGKTSVAHAVGKLTMFRNMYIPYAIYVDGLVIKVFDSVMHHKADEENDDSGLMNSSLGSRNLDPRWVLINRPFVEVGGELTLDGLDLVFDEVNKYYEAPFQVKANGGVLLIDDFGRQLVRPRDLLNRWIVPLESKIDYLTLHTGRKIELPFDVMILFATNLPPKDLVDEAFLRRLRHKIELNDPDFDAYRDIFVKVAQVKGITYDEEVLAYLLQEWYIKQKRHLRASHPRDICDQILDITNYEAIKPEMTKKLIDRAAKAFFVKL